MASVRDQASCRSQKRAAPVLAAETALAPVGFDGMARREPAGAEEAAVEIFRCSAGDLGAPARRPPLADIDILPPPIGVLPS